MKMLSEMKEPSSLLPVPSLTFQEKRPVVVPKTSVLFTRRPAKMTFGGVPSTSRWTNVCSVPFSSFFHSLIPTTDTFEINRERAIDYLNTRDNVYVFDGYAGVSFSTPHLR